MPSIPQSLLWISLVVLWLFVLVPMLISKRDSVRRTSDVALATRVLNSGRNAQRLRRGPAAGHHSDPHWQPSADHLDEDLDEDLEDEAPAEVRVQRTVVVAAARVEVAEPDYLDVDIVDEDSGALPVGAMSEAAAAAEPEELDEPELELEFETEAEPEPEPVAVEEPVAQFEAESEAQTERIPVDLDGTDEVDEAEADETDIAESDEPDAADEDAADEAAADQADPDDLADDEYEYVADSSGLEPEAEDEPADEDQAEAPVASLSATRQRRFESKTAADVSARKFRFRKRVLAVLAVTLLFSAAAAFLVTPSAWWLCGGAGTLTVLYLAYLRRQTRIEEQLRRRRAQRMARSRLGVESTEDHKLDVVPARLRRPGAVVLDIDDEDPIFEHLAYASYGSMSREYDLPRAAGQ
ncbi:gephyrin-like molybdotransferase receptor GlpR [Mycobacterium sp. URHD0025]|uniref:divisome protein SepX/GlpR n=1 Tax=Mycobacterium sp. URHD0025 TaxID=1298864 RepID=UPI000412C5AE|nr:gephyrin-like molybdotransferase receptor GlpR [Mycobacterium sp. URHD0025]